MESIVNAKRADFAEFDIYSCGFTSDNMVEKWAVSFGTDKTKILFVDHFTWKEVKTLMFIVIDLSTGEVFHSSTVIILTIA